MDLADIQPGIITTHSPGSAIHGSDVLCRLTGGDVAVRQKQLLQMWEQSETAPKDCVITVGFTSSGLSRLGVAAALIWYLPSEFVFGAHTRREQLGDPVTGDPLQRVSAEGSADLLVMIAGPDAAVVDRMRDALLGHLGGTDSVVGELRTFVRPDRREHFGFVDGVANPHLEGSGQSGPPLNGVKSPDGWRALRAGEIIYGYPNEADALPGPRIAHDLLRNGSFLVWRKIEQHVERFAALQDRLADAAGISPEAAGARIVGRNADGTPLATDAVSEDFDFGHDRTVPLQSHVRRSNPRATEGFGDPRAAFPFSDRVANPQLTYGGFHRILRRSMLWEENGRVGTIFRCYQASIADQFEFIQRNWLNDGNAFRQGRAIDPLAGAPCPEPVVGAGTDPLTGAPEFTDPRAHERLRLVSPLGPTDDDRYATCTFDALTTPLATLYLFVPGIRALSELAYGRFGEQ